MTNKNIQDHNKYNNHVKLLMLWWAGDIRKYIKSQTEETILQNAGWSSYVERSRNDKLCGYGEQEMGRWAIWPFPIPHKIGFHMTPVSLKCICFYSAELVTISIPCNQPLSQIMLCFNCIQILPICFLISFKPVLSYFQHETYMFKLIYWTV